MFEKITPEQAGVSSDKVAEFISLLNRRGLAMHSVLLMKGDKLFAEYYWAPFHKDFCHRMYSETKSYVSIAIGLLIEDGKLSLDDKIVSHFPDKCPAVVDDFLAEQTVRDMLMMETLGSPRNWFTADDEPDRTRLYMEKRGYTPRASGTVWEYDSAGSQVLAALAERLAGKPLFDFLYERIFDKLGTFRTATILKTKTEDSWGDSALLCTARDMASFARFLMNYGVWNGERLMNEAYIREATSALVCNNEDGWGGAFRDGYGYQIWRTECDGFAFVGMGDQLTVCLPEQDLIFVCTADNQGYPAGRKILINALFDHIVYPMQKEALPKSAEAEERLCAAASDLKLRAVKGGKTSSFAKELEGKTYVCKDNPMGISRFSFRFTEKGGELHYTNEQGDKVLPFGMCENCFSKFPQYGYSDDHGGLVTTNGFLYDAAVSGAWVEEKKLMLVFQIIDRYFGNGVAMFAFKDEEATVSMKSTAENFLNEYRGVAVARIGE